MKKAITCILMALFTMTIIAQTKDTDGIIIINRDHETVYEQSFRGMKNGLSYAISKAKKTINWISYYNLGDMVFLASFADDGSLRTSFDNFATISPIESSIAKRQGYTTYVFTRSCRCTSYYPNGNIESQGLLLFFDEIGPETDSFEYGEWYYYFDDGMINNVYTYK